MRLKTNPSSITTHSLQLPDLVTRGPAVPVKAKTKNLLKTSALSALLVIVSLPCLVMGLCLPCDHVSEEPFLLVLDIFGHLSSS